MGKRRINKTLSLLHWHSKQKISDPGFTTSQVSAPTKRQSSKNGFSYSDKRQETDTWEDRLTKEVLKPGSPSPKGNQFPVAILGKIKHSHLAHHHGSLQTIRTLSKNPYFFNQSWEHINVQHKRIELGPHKLQLWFCTRTSYTAQSIYSQSRASSTLCSLSWSSGCATAWGKSSCHSLLLLWCFPPMQGACNTCTAAGPQHSPPAVWLFCCHLLKRFSHRHCLTERQAACSVTNG